jgi:hypothetical protein
MSLNPTQDPSEPMPRRTCRVLPSPSDIWAFGVPEADQAAVREHIASTWPHPVTVSFWASTEAAEAYLTDVNERARVLAEAKLSAVHAQVSRWGRQAAARGASSPKGSDAQIEHKSEARAYENAALAIQAAIDGKVAANAPSWCDIADALPRIMGTSVLNHESLVQRIQADAAVTTNVTAVEYALLCARYCGELRRWTDGERLCYRVPGSLDRCRTCRGRCSDHEFCVCRACVEVEYADVASLCDDCRRRRDLHEKANAAQTMEPRCLGEAPLRDSGQPYCMRCNADLHAEDGAPLTKRAQLVCNCGYHNEGEPAWCHRIGAAVEALARSAVHRSETGRAECGSVVTFKGFRGA